MKPTLLTLVAALLTAACASTADGPPEILVDRTACSHCGMLISEPVYAAAYGAAAGEKRVFDDIGCLLKALNSGSAGSRRVWFHDAATTAWMDGAVAVFVVSSDIRTPMGGGVIAYGDRAAAELTVRRHGGTIVGTLGELLARHGAKS